MAVMRNRRLEKVEVGKEFELTRLDLQELLRLNLKEVDRDSLDCRVRGEEKEEKEEMRKSGHLLLLLTYPTTSKNQDGSFAFAAFQFIFGIYIPYTSIHFHSWQFGSLVALQGHSKGRPSLHSR